nr:phospholipase-like protein [Tanacetum cinerariifolium]
MLRRQHKVDDQHHDKPFIYYMEGHKLHFGHRKFSLINGFRFGTDEEIFGKLSDDDAIRLYLLLDLEVLSHERNDRHAKLKFTDEFSSMTSDLCNSLNGMFADLIELADPDEDVAQDYFREEELRLCLEGEEKIRCEHQKLIVEENRIRLDEAKRLRPENSNWAMVSCYFAQLLLQNGMPLYYANGERYTTPWSENDSIVAEHGLSLEITQSAGGSSDTSEGPKTMGASRIVEDQMKNTLKMEHPLRKEASRFYRYEDPPESPGLRLASNQSSNSSASTNPNTKGRNRRHPKPRIENLDLDDPTDTIGTMADQRTMAQLLQAPTEGYEDAIVVPAITAENFELKHGLLTLVQNKQFFGHDKEDPHAHVRYFNKITSTLKFLNVPNTSIKLMLFPFSLEAKHGTDSRSSTSLSPSWIFRITQLDTFYNALNSKDQDSLNSAAGGNFLDRMPRDCLGIIESKSKVRYSRNKPVVAKVSTTASTSSVSPDVAELKDMVRALLLDKKGQSPAPVKAVEENCVTCGAPAYQALTPQTHGVSKEDFSAYVKANDAVMKNMQT